MTDGSTKAPRQSVGTGTDAEGGQYAVIRIQDHIVTVSKVVNDRRVMLYRYGGDMTVEILEIAASARYGVNPPRTTMEERFVATMAMRQATLRTAA